ncbi:MAG: hypothetical protein ACJ74G_18470 [Blastocatellia bacterium]
MQRLLCCVALFVFILVHPLATPNSRTALRLAGYASAAVQEETVPLTFDTPVSSSVPAGQGNTCSLGMTQYAIQYPGGAMRIKLEVSTIPTVVASSLVIYVRFGQRVAREDGRTIADFSNFGSQPLYFPGAHLFEAGTYFVAIANCGSEQVDYTIRARLLTPPDADTASIGPETSFGVIPAAPPGSCSLARTQYRVISPGSHPCGGALITIHAISNQNISLYARRDQRVAIEDGRIVADLGTAAPTMLPFISLPMGGTYFIAVVNCSTEPVDYLVSLFEAVIDPPFGPLINGCDLSRNPSGQYVLTIFGANIKEGATVTVGGLTPKKVRFVELEPGSTNSYRVIRLVKKFCNGLPGNIVITNPAPCAFPSAFFCNQACAN